MNPLIFRKGVCDPHIHIFEGKAYLYATHDAPGYENGFHMDDWQIWSSENLIDWTLETVVHPEDFYCGALNQCWAVDAAYRDGHYYLYFSTGDWGVGVAVSDHPAGPFRDALGGPLADYRCHPQGVPKWDPCVFVDDDGEAYLIVGECRVAKPWDCYLIARLESDMIHLAEPLRRIEYYNNPCPEDKPSVHKYRGRYYLTHSSYVAVSDSVYGPYEHLGNMDCNIDHGSFFTYHNQTYFASGGMDNPDMYLRASFLTPCHYRENGEIVVDQKVMGYGCGQYDAVWDKIQTSWYFDASRECKKEKEKGEFVTGLLKGEYLFFPEISNVEENALLCVKGRAVKNGSQETFARLIIHEDAVDGPVLGTVLVGSEDSIYEGRLCCSAGKKSLYFAAEEEMELENFRFESGKRRDVIQPVFSLAGRGASIKFDENASFHQVLQNMELKAAFMEGFVDGSAGGEGTICVPYFCTGADTRLAVYVNEECQGELYFPVTKEAALGKNPAVSRAQIRLKPGLNKIKIASDKGYQDGRLAVEHILVETKDSVSRVYAAADGALEPKGNGKWDGLPQREVVLGAYSGRMVKYLDDVGDELTFSAAIPGEGGKFSLKIHYCRGENGDSAFEILVNGQKQGQISMPSTGGFTVENMRKQEAVIDLESGENKVSFRKCGQKDEGVFVDAFEISPLKW